MKRSRKGGSAWTKSNLSSHRSSWSNFWTSHSSFNLLSHFFFSSAIIHELMWPMVITKALRPAFETISSQQAARAQQKSYSIHAESFSSTPKTTKRKKGDRVIADRVTYYQAWSLNRLVIWEAKFKYLKRNFIRLYAKPMLYLMCVVWNMGFCQSLKKKKSWVEN